MPLLGIHFLSLENILLFVLPSLCVLLFILYPIISVLQYGLGQSSFKEIFDIYNKIPKTWIINTVKVGTLSTLFTTVIAVAIANYLIFEKGKWSKVLNRFLLLTMISPPFVSSLAYIMLYGKRGLITFHLFNINWNPYGIQGIVLMQTLSHVALCTFMIKSAMENFDESQFWVSRDLGGSFSYSYFKIIFPNIKSGILAAMSIIFVQCISDFGTPIIIGGNFKVLATEAYLSIVGKGDLKSATVMLLLLVIPSIMAYYFYRKEMDNYKTGDLIRNKKSSIKLHGIIKWVGSFLIVTYTIIMVFQYAAIFVSAFGRIYSGGIIWNLDYIKEFFTQNKFTPFIRSIKYAFIVGAISTLLGFLLSYYIEFKNTKICKGIDFLAVLPYVLPGPFFGLAYILGFNHKPIFLLGTASIVVLNCIFRQLGISMRANASVMKQIPKNIELAARDLGGSRIRSLFEVILPLCDTALLASFINSFTATMTTVGAIIFLISPKAKVATTEMFNALRDGEYGLAAVYGLMIICVTLFVNLFAAFIQKRLRDKKEKAA